MDSSVSLEDQIWFLRVCHHIPFSLYQTLYHTLWSRFRSSAKTCSFHESSHTFPLHLLWVWGQKMGRDSSVGKATRYGLDGRGFESRCGRYFPHPSRPVLGSTQPPIKWVGASWNVMAQAQKPDFVFRRNGRVHLNRRGRQFSRLLAAEVCTSAIVHHVPR